MTEEAALKIMSDAKIKVNPGFYDRYQLFLTQCAEIASANGITVRKLLDLTLGRSAQKRNIDEVFQWHERMEFYEVFTALSNEGPAS